NKFEMGRLRALTSAENIVFAPTNREREIVYSHNAKAACIMEQDVIHYLETAALHPQRRGELIARALQELLITLPAVGMALVWPSQDRTAPWKLYYAGERPESMRRWLAARLNVSLDATVGVLQRDLSKLAEMSHPQLICLQPAPTFPAGLWI